MRKLFYQWAGIGILSLTGWGVDVMPNNESWIPSTILWVVAGIWFLGTIVYFFKHRNDIYRRNEKTNPLDDIKTDLITLGACEREVASGKVKTPCSKETAMRIYNDFTAIFVATNIIGFVMSLVEEIRQKHSADPLIKFFKKFGDILDSNDYGLKVELEKSDLYKSSRMDLAQKRVKIKLGKKKNSTTQNNIDRVRLLSYGLNSSILLRGVLDATPVGEGIVPAQIKVALESIESEAEKTLNTMLNDLENEWKVNINGV